ncbi:F-box/FBD/LRR-repeat protein At5g22660-like [Chenopodium quinoa]|uniref:F-box/FBD/LRR-repeat protein At5g22660-like n=1 Tax=Chenopodium quinoa TaxID=63459 RepID=UPI000B792B40|nr:F-box/FBD/LRR-repeat protein At5g22660-like [Chenopodium quinoa]
MARLRMMNNNGGEDRLSSLPDPILIDILSRLPTNTAATTAILSPRWHYLWTHITSIDINCRKFTTSIDKFADIDKVFQRLASPLINSFTLRGCDRSRGSEWLSDLSKHVNSWLHQICDSKVQKICIKVIERDFKLMNTVTPSIIFQTPALVVLELVSELSCFVPDHAIKDDTTTTNFNLPKLKKLSVTVLLFHCNFWGRLIKSCPSLENLSMVICHIRQPRKIIADINISAKNLERLNLELIGCKLLAKVTIDAPSLKYLSVSDSNPSLTLLPESNVMILNINKFLGSISHVSSLTLDLIAFTFSTRFYPNLSYLRLNTHFTNNEYKMLLVLFRLCPNLEVLVLSSTS